MYSPLSCGMIKGWRKKLGDYDAGNYVLDIEEGEVKG
jgi:hypothetical protein